ncbi:MAG TPA: hypothetical protein VMV10_24255 [Pirellulales bacterium]|nr:hypothetical protein [Pirellulales bacterium]
MRRFQLLVLAGITVAVAAGCAGERPVMQKLFRPGPTNYQRQKAERFDPYNEIPIGPRDDTSRPLDYQHPIPEAAQGRWNEWGWPRFGHP